jgi:glutamine---fructose-6-phosphate transaminase (isomerizing)
VCGIVGYVGKRPVQDLLLASLRRLEYRGYDSAGISVIADGHIETVRAVGNLDALAQRLEAHRNALVVAGASAEPYGGQCTTGIAHTRWATHGRVSEENAHPHNDSSDRVHVVVNGIVENYIELKHRLSDMGATFTSETDAEVIAHLVAHHLAQGTLAQAVRAAYSELQGHYAFVAMSLDDPEVLVGVRKECPLIVGRGEGEQFLASAIPAFLEHTRSLQYINDGEIVVIGPDDVTFFGPDGTEIERELTEIDWDEEQAEKGGYETFMLKEIYEQADVLADTISDRLANPDRVDLTIDGALDEELLRGARRIVIVACGTSFNAGLIGRYALEEWARIPVDMDVASEYRYRNPVVSEGDLVIGISQSGETADTLAAMRLARERGARVLAVTNVMGSQATREADGVLFTRAGQEVSVAATKTFVCQVAVLYLLALNLARLRGTLQADDIRRLIGELRALPSKVELLVGSLDLTEIARAHKDAEFFLYLGRHAGRGVALEGALKLKEIAYVATDAYAAGEMKHGPIALLDESTPVVCVATESPVLEKMISNMQEVRARGAHVIALASEGDLAIGEHAEQVIRIPSSDWMLQSLLAVIPLQLLAYEIARLRGLNVDQPRNLAKTVTVE